MLIDSHVNLHAPQFAEDQAEVIVRARQAGVRLMVTICDRVSSFEAVHAIAMAHDDIFATVGTHPHEAKENPDLTARTLEDLAGRPKVVGIGECGLDFHYDLSPREVQARVFRVHAEAARRTGLPLVVHTREADGVMAQVLGDEFARGPFKLLMHCYTSGPELGRKAAELGAWFSVSGIATFKAADDARTWPPSRIAAVATNRPISLISLRNWPRSGAGAWPRPRPARPTPSSICSPPSRGRHDP